MTGDERARAPNPGLRFKHLACNNCRKRKLRCNGERPVCKTCETSGRDCDWEDTVRKTGPRRGYVRSLEARLADVESLLGRRQLNPSDHSGLSSRSVPDEDFQIPRQSLEDESSSPPMSRPRSAMPDAVPSSGGLASDPLSQSPEPASTSNAASWELSAVGLQEPLPSQRAIDDLHQIFFETFQPSQPFIHKGRYLAAMSLPATSRLRPPVCLSYAIWALAASMSEHYDAVAEHFYLRARKYMEVDEILGRGQGVVTLAHAQATAYLAVYETKRLYFPRAWLSVGRAARLCHMMNLHRLDGIGLNVKETLPSSTTWIEQEERRRTFWGVFVHDRYQSIASGWPTIFDERDITTNLPCNEEDFMHGTPSPTSLSLNDALNPAGVKSLSLFAAATVIATIFGRTVTHLHRKDLEEGEQIDSDLRFWRRHDYLDNILLNTLQYLPDHLQIRSGLSNPRIVLLHINIQASTICLHQAANFKASSSPNRDGDRLEESKARCLGAMENMLTILRLVDPAVIGNIGPWLPFCLYLSARVLVQALHESADDQHRSESHLDSLNLLMGILRSMRAKSPYTTSLLLQLENDMATFGKLNPIGHIVVPMDQITETLEQGNAAQAFKLNTF